MAVACDEQGAVGRSRTNASQIRHADRGAFAGKTGFTNLAKKTYVGAAQRNGRRLVVVEMYGSGDLYGQAIRLFDWGFSQ